MAPGLAGQAAACCTEPCPAPAKRRRPPSSARLATASGEHPAPCLGAEEKVRACMMPRHGGQGQTETVLVAGRDTYGTGCLSWQCWEFSPMRVGQGMPPASFRVGAPQRHSTSHKELMPCVFWEAGLGGA